MDLQKEIVNTINSTHCKPQYLPTAFPHRTILITMIYSVSILDRDRSIQLIRNLRYGR
uniref:Uncharacterized protein n=1 Tax=Arundo donax TaxID=35708 RepID=A0A0A9F101_ARUDO